MANPNLGYICKKTQHMKRTMILAAVAATLISNAANAQLGVQKVTGKVVPTVTLGVKAGANLQRISGDATINTSMKPGILGGVFLSVNKKKNGVRVEGMVHTAKFAAAASSSVYTNTVSLDIPVLFEHRLVKRVWLQLGPQFTSLISAKANTGADMKGSFRNSDVSAVGGLEIQLPMKFTLSGRYILGFVNVNNTVPAATWKNSSIQIAVGYRFIN